MTDLIAEEIAELHAVQTKAFIDASPTYIRFVRTQRISDGAGGTKDGTPVTVREQRVRVVGARRSAPVVTTEGHQIRADKTVVGPADLDVALGDTFDHKGETYEVVGVSSDPGWRTSAEAVRRG